MLQIKWRVVGKTPTSVKLSDRDGTFGVRRVDTLDVVVPAGTAMTATTPSGTYYKTVTEPEINLRYEYYVEVTEGENTYWVNGFINGTPAWDDLNTLAGVRRMLVLESGRYDLVRDAANNDFTDLGLANYYINNAQRWLDRRLPYHKTSARLYKTLAAGASMITFTMARSVTDVWRINDDGSFTRIPWATLHVGLAPDQKDDTQEDHPDVETVVFGNHWATQAIYVEPDTESSRNLIIWANWYCPKLVNDTDVSFWTVQHPELLVRAACMQIEIGMRNSQGVNDFSGPLLDDVRHVSMDLAEEEQAGPHDEWRANG